MRSRRGGRLPAARQRLKRSSERPTCFRPTCARSPQTLRPTSASRSRRRWCAATRHVRWRGDRPASQPDLLVISTHGRTGFRAGGWAAWPTRSSVAPAATRWSSGLTLMRTRFGSTQASSNPSRRSSCRWTAPPSQSGRSRCRAVCRDFRVDSAHGAGGRIPVQWHRLTGGRYLPELLETLENACRRPLCRSRSTEARAEYRHGQTDVWWATRHAARGIRQTTRHRPRGDDDARSRRLLPYRAG